MRAKVGREVHPVAALFPMLAEDELRELADDIKQRGLLQPVVLDVEGRVLDGRNRLAACGLAKVEPTFVTYEGDDPGGYALAVNIARRHLTKGQQAMIVAQARVNIITDAVFSKNTDSLRDVAENHGISASRISYAATVLNHAPDLADSVVSGAMSLNDAYETARRNKQGRDSREEQLARLRAEAPDLADLVIEERMTLAEAVAASAERQRRQAENQRDARALLVRAVDLIAPSTMSAGFVDTWAEHLGDVDADLIKRTGQAGQILLDLAERITR